MIIKSILYISSILFFSYIETNFPTIYSVDSAPVIHNLVTSCVSNYIFYNDPQYIMNIYEQPQEKQSPLILYFPIFSCAYGLHHLYSVIQKKKSFEHIIHGISFFSIGPLFMYYENFHWIYPGLLMETSSVFLAFIHKPYGWIKYCFALTFIFYRNIFFPYFTYLVYKNNMTIFDEPGHYHLKGCFIFFISINCLNFYWGYKIINKFIRIIKND
jgi:hypothetical protein